MLIHKIAAFLKLTNDTNTSYLNKTNMSNYNTVITPITFVRINKFPSLVVEYTASISTMLDKSHICASMYPSILLDRARYSPPTPGDLDRRWDHTEVFLASCGRLGRTGLKR